MAQKSPKKSSVKRHSKAVVDWNKELRPLLKKYNGRKHPLAYQNPYQLLVMIVLSARASDAGVNNLAPELFKQYPSFKHLSEAKPEELYPLLRVPGFRKKAEWIIAMAQSISSMPAIPNTMKELTNLKGFGRKSANVYMSQVGLPPEGVIVDLHTLRVAPRLGIAKGTDPVKIEEQLMKEIRQELWHELGMSLTYLGRELCRPTDPKCSECPVHKVCVYYRSQK